MLLSITLPHPWEDEWELALHLLEEHNSADRVKCIGNVQGDQCPVWMVTQEISDAMHYVLSTSWHAHSKLHRGECARELLLKLHMMAELMSLWKMVPMAMGLLPPFFLGYWNQPSTKEVWSEVLWDEQVIGSYPPA